MVTWVRPLRADPVEPVGVVGAKAHGLAVLRGLGLPVPAGFVVGTAACRAFRRDGRLPDGLRAELAAAVGELRGGIRREPGRPAQVSVRSGAAVSMPGMLTTVLGLEPTAERVERAVVAVFASWENPRARVYRELNGVPHDLGTAVVVQAMVHGDRDDRSGSGVAFSRDPTTGWPGPFGEVLFGRCGDAVVSGAAPTRPLDDLRPREPAVWADLLDALHRVEQHYRDACHVEFTVEAGALWLLQVRAGGFTGAAAVRLAVDLVDEGVIDRREALLRVSPRDLREARRPRLATAGAGVLARGIGAGPGVAVGRVATTVEAAVAMAASGPVVLVRPETSPLDLRGMAAAAGIVTARGGPASHAAVVARAMGKPAVVGVADLVVSGPVVRVGDRTIGPGETVTIDGTSGEVVLGRPGLAPPPPDPALARLLGWADEVMGAGDA